MIKYSFLFLFTALFFSCKESNEEIKQKSFDINTLPKNWVKLTEKNKKFIVFNSCDSGNLLLNISKKGNNFEILLHGQQEDSSFKILETKQLKDTVFITTISIDSNKKQSFKFFWTKKQQGVGRWITKFPNGFISDFTFVTNEKQNNFETIDQPCRECWGDECDELEKNSAKTDTSITIIKKIFDDYVAFQESTDSPASKDLMSKTIKSIDKITAAEDFEILINVWMYYDPTDFPSRDLVFSVLEKNKVESINAIKNRIKNKKDWETSDSAPYSELNNLIKQLEK